jgi:hypothetical protein
MSLVKGKQEFRTILDFSEGKLSKNKVKNALRKVEVRELVRLENSNTLCLVENDIRVGMYQIRLSFSSFDSTHTRSKLREYGGFRVNIYERNRKGNTIQYINLSRDKRFHHQKWAKLNHDYAIRIKNLVDIIVYVSRLNQLKMFL